MKYAIITGHSKGLGAALCKQMVTGGYRVLGLSRSSLELDTEGLLGDLQQLSLDLSDNLGLQSWLRSSALQDFFQGVEEAVLVNNAGIIQPINPIGSQADHEIIDSVAINITAPLLLTNAFVNATQMVPQRMVLNISSGAARSPIQSWSIYCAGKAALDYYTRCLVEEKPENLKAVSIAPGIVDTEMQSAIRESDASAFPLIDTFRDFKTSGQLTSPEEVAKKLLAYLRSDLFGSNPCEDIWNLS